MEQQQYAVWTSALIRELVHQAAYLLCDALPHHCECCVVSVQVSRGVREDESGSLMREVFQARRKENDSRAASTDAHVSMNPADDVRAIDVRDT